MRMLRGIVLLAALPALSLAADAPKVQVERVTGEGFRLTGSFPGITDPMVAQRLLQPFAASACLGAPYTLGHYRFESTEPLPGAKSGGQTSLTLVQDVHCGLVAAPENALPVAPRDAKDEALILTKTNDYLAAKDRGDFDAAAAMLKDEVRSYMRADNWRKPRSAFNAAAGTPAARNVLRVTWYDNPPDAPPGRYAAADYTASYASSAFYCGYVVWLLQPDGSYRIIREDEGVATPDLVKKIPADQMASARAQLGCRD